MFLNLLIEVIIITILVGGAYYGYKRGFFRMAAKPARLALCIALSFSLCRIVGSNVLAPIISSRLNERLQVLATSAVRAASTVIAFALLFILTRLALSVVLSLAAKFLDCGIIGKINRALGFILAGLLAFVAAMCFASLADYLLGQAIFDNSDLAGNFSGGLLYRFLLMISPIGP